MAKWITNAQIAQMSYNELGQKLISGELNEKRLRNYYSGARQTAISRSKRIEKSEFGVFDKKPTFMKLKNLPTTQALLHEISDVNKYLKTERSTITGQKHTRDVLIGVAAKMGFDIDYENYPKFRQFMDWFKHSEFAKLYDSDAPELPEAFEQGASPADWQKLFEAYKERDRKNAESNS